MENLERLVRKYDDVHRVPARRLLFTFMESDNLSDLRRKIGLHEQTLTLWYSSLMYGSLRRLEYGQEGIDAKISDLTKKLVESLAKQEKLASRRRIITVLKNLQESDPSRHHRRREDISHLDDDSLKAVLRNAGIKDEQIKANLKFAKDYIRAPKEERQEGSPLDAGYSYSRPERKSSRRSSRKQMETEIEQKEEKAKQKETEVRLQIHETKAAISELSSFSEDRGRSRPHSIPVNIMNMGDKNAKSRRPMSEARTIQRVQLDQFDPGVLAEHGISWEPDWTDKRYIVLKQELSEEMIKTLYKDTKTRRAANAEEFTSKIQEERRTRPGRASSASAYIDREDSYLKPDYDVLRRRARTGPRLRPQDDRASVFSDSDSRSSISSYGGDHDLFIRRDSLRPGDRRSRPAWPDGPSTDLFGEMKSENIVPSRLTPQPKGFFDRRNPEIFVTPNSPSSSRNQSVNRTRPVPHKSASGGYFDESRSENIIEVRRSKSSERNAETPVYDSRFPSDTGLRRSSSARRPGDENIRLIRKMDRIDSMDVPF